MMDPRYYSSGNSTIAMDVIHAEDSLDVLLEKLRCSGDARRIRQDFSLVLLDHLDVKLNSISTAIKSLRNAFAPIHILPPEILAYIFSLLSDSAPSFLPDLQAKEVQIPYSWLNVTQVCRFWRETALAFPFLWTTIDSTYQLAALASIDRSAAAKLKVYLHDRMYYTHVSPMLERGRFLQTLAPHSDRFEEFHILPEFRYDPAILGLFHFPAPNLKSLTVGVQASDGFLNLPTMFDGYMPKLERLTLGNFTVWTGNSFTDLTHLCLYDQVLQNRLPMEAFLDILVKSPRLEELILVNASPAPVFMSPALDEDEELLVELSQLRVLDIGGWPSAQTIRRFLTHLVLPSATKVFIWDDHLMGEDQNILSLLPSNLIHLRPFHNLTTIRFAIDLTPAKPQLLSVQDGTLVMSGKQSLDKKSSLHSVFQTLDVQHVEELTLGSAYRMDIHRDVWYSALRAMPRLKRLQVFGIQGGSMILALRFGNVKRDGESEEMPTPEYRTRELVCPELSEMVVDCRSRLAPSLILDVVEMIANRGIPLESLVVLTGKGGWSKIYADNLDLKRFVKEVRFVVEDDGEDDRIDKVVQGWPTEGFMWTLKRLNNSRRHHIVGD